MAEQEGRWVTVNGAHVLIKDGESENPFAKLKKTVNIKDDSVDDIAEHSRQKVRATREFIEQTVKDINDFNSGKGKKGQFEGISNSDLQAMAEAFGAQWGFTPTDEDRVLKEIRTRADMTGGYPEMKEMYERNAEISRRNLQKYNAHPMEGTKEKDLTDKQKAKMNEYFGSGKHLYK